jgi:hypothetical protein
MRRALLALAVALAAGCGGEDAEADPRCLARAYNAAEAAAVAEMYERGELGSEEEVSAVLEHDGMVFFDDSGRMIPYEQLDRPVQSQLVAWFSNGPVGQATEEQRERAVEEADPDC